MDSYLDWLEQTTSGSLIDLELTASIADSYSHPGASTILRTSIDNTSQQVRTNNVGLRIAHKNGLTVRVPALTCVAHTGYTDCRGSTDLALGEEPRVQFTLTQCSTNS